ncbi:reverse transcriptase domain-containing protein [Tanacetum coccineum]
MVPGMPKCNLSRNDFIVERPDEESSDEPMVESEELPEPWTLFTDGSSCIDGSGVGLILTNPNGVEFTYAMRFRFEATNNEAEYEALIAESSNGETPFSLTYGTEAVIPAEIGMPTFRTVEVDLTKNDEALEINLDLIKEKREQAAIQEAKSKAKMEKYYNSKVRSTSFKPGDMVYRSNDASHAKDGGKLGPNWEGPYKVTESLGKGAYKLKDYKGNELSRTWNICNLKKCYVHEVKEAAAMPGCKKRFPEVQQCGPAPKKRKAIKIKELHPS